MCLQQVSSADSVLKLKKWLLCLSQGLQEASTARSQGNPKICDEGDGHS